MTSKSLLWSRWKENNKRRSWLWALSSIIFILGVGVRELFIFQAAFSFSHNISRFDIFNEMGFDMGISFLIMAFAVLAGVQGFSYLHSRKKVDMYHSQPVSEKSRFFQIYVNGLLCFYIPYIVGYLIKIFIAACYGGMSYFVLKQVLVTLFLYLIFYFAIYQISVLMTILTSNVLFSIGCTIVVIFYELIIRKICIVLSDTFFHTYYYENDKKIIKCIFSPFYLFLEKIEDIQANTSAGEMLKNLGNTGIWMIVFSVITLSLAYFSYRKRPLENVKMPFAFSWLRTVFKVIIIIPILLIMLWNINNQLSGNLAIVFSVLFFLIGMFVSHGIVEVLLELDLKAVWKHKVSMCVAAGIAGLVFAGFYFDWIGYNSYVPKVSQIESAAILPYETRNTEYAFKDMNITSIEELCDLAKENCNFKFPLEAEYADENADSISQEMIFLFRLKNGEKVYRVYNIVLDKNDKRLWNIMHSDEYLKEAYLWLYDIEYMRELEEYSFSIEWTDKRGEETNLCKNDKESAKQLREALKKDIEEYGDTVEREEQPLGSIRVSDEIQEDWNYDKEEIYEIYPEYKNIIQYLENNGIKTDMSIGFVPENIEYIEIGKIDGNLLKNGMKEISIVEDKNKIYEILSCAITGTDWTVQSDFNQEYAMGIKYKNEEESVAYRLTKEVPDWVQNLK